MTSYQKRHSLNMSRETLDSTTTSESNKRHSLNMSRETLESRTMSIGSIGSITSKPSTLREEIDNIKESLDSIKTSILSQQLEMARDFEDRVRHTYDGVINDLNEVRQKVNSLGDEVAADTKFKKWVPVAPIRKDVLQNIYEIRRPSKLTSSKSVDFVDSCDNDRSNLDPQNKHHCSGFVGQGRFSSGKPKMAPSDNLNKSQTGSMKSISSSRNNSTTNLQQNKSTSGSRASVSESRTQVPGFGCCFTGDNKTYPYRTYRTKYYSFYRYQRPGHSWGPSRSGSRSTLDDDDWWDENKGPMCGVVPDDWRAKVAPYMWEGWPLPGIDKMDVERLRERLKKFDEIREELVRVQNEYRARHACPALTVTDELSRGAQEWAEILAIKGYAQYSDSQSRGENILVVDIENELTGRQVVDTWYRESRDFNYKHPGWQRGTSNFTQMIWKTSREAGVGIAKFPHADTYVVVVQYKPAGNVNAPGQFRHNIPSFNDIYDRQGGPENQRIAAGHQIETDKEANDACLVQQTPGTTDIDDEGNALTTNDTNIDRFEEMEHPSAVTEELANACDELNDIDEINLDVSDKTPSDDEASIHMLDKDKEYCINDITWSSSSSHSSVNSLDDVLLTFDDNQEEMFREKLVERGLVGKQIVDEMIQDLVNEKLEFDNWEVIKYGSEPKRLSFDRQSSVSPSFEEDGDDYMASIDEFEFGYNKDTGKIKTSDAVESDRTIDRGVDISDFDIDNEFPKRLGCELLNESECVYERQSSVSASIEQACDYLTAIDDVETDSLSDASVVYEDIECIAAGGLEPNNTIAFDDHFGTHTSMSASRAKDGDGLPALDGVVSQHGNDDDEIIYENIEYKEVGSVSPGRMKAVESYFHSRTSVSDSIEEGGGSLPIEGTACRGKDDFGAIPKVGILERGPRDLHTDQRRKQLNRKLVVRVNSQSDRISDV